ncbi:MAG: alpha-ribazole phosphatase [Chlorobi bacterium]|nr:alpha-ribazole phosphatase [Chlorobiota bacterium]
MKIVLVRHTKVAVPKGICYGSTDVEPASSYEEEKKKIISLLNNRSFVEIYSSPLKRCLKLAGDIVPSGMEIIRDKRLQELDFGKWEMQPWDDISKSKHASLWFNDFLNIACPGGESYRELLKRVKEFIRDMTREPVDGNVLIVTHGGVIRAFHSILNNTEPEKAFDLKVEYGQIMEFTV